MKLPFSRSAQAKFRPDTLPPSMHNDPKVDRPVATDTPLAAAHAVTPSINQRIRTQIDHMARHYPARLAMTVFASIVATVTALLSLPIATTSGIRAPLADALFNATSAVCVTGLTTVDTANYWSVFGQAVLALGISIGGLGVMTLASILGFAVSRHIGLTQRMLAASETKTSSLGQVGSLLKAVVTTAVAADLLIFAALLPRYLTLDYDLAHALWYALFMAISIFNNAGFVILPDGLAPHVSDVWMITPIIIGTAVGAVGFPVIMDLTRNWRTPRRLTLHAKLTLTTYVALAIVGSLIVGTLEWSNPDTYGDLTITERIMHSLLAGVNARSSGISILDVGQMTRGTWFVQDILMFIGGGSASTAGGIKVTTIAVLTLAVLAEARGDRDIEAFGRRIPPSTVRLAVAVMLIGVFLVSSAVLILLLITPYSLDVVLFESISAFATVGLSTGITGDLPDGGKYVLSALMYLGRTGTMTVAAALALRERRRVIRMPQERPIIG
ncbi:MAG: potassium transporter TrkG [Actinomycetaceae bacterium]|nr:potassium transporter TrkG [Actinomycetaceae bacterium]